MESRAAAAQKAEVLAAIACGKAALAAAVFVAVVPLEAGAEVGAEVASRRSGTSAGSTSPPLYCAAGTVGAADSVAAMLPCTAKASAATKEMQRMVMEEVPARVE
eukprot:TRINITY_DN95157_c0_g1_i1.p3 TRINITY_DN95157_c0_g1~~TRINITY_DN95157_c0_g1_i1.p3  ORF type:complete len:105 (-),score=37.70 TRINITY_DN95157_c0_g1_i1:55-369(-)